MKHLWIIRAWLVLLLGWGLGFSGHTAAAQQATGTLKGIVTGLNGAFVAGATITAHAEANENSEELGRTTTGSDGTWQMTVPAGRLVWVHFNTFGPLWGYSYSPPFTLQAGQVVDQVNFVLAPREVSAPPTAAPPTATAAPSTAVPATATAVPPTATAVPIPPTVVAGAQPGMPSTGNGTQWLETLAGLITALLLLGIGSRVRRTWLQR